MFFLCISTAAPSNKRQWHIWCTHGSIASAALHTFNHTRNGHGPVYSTNECKKAHIKNLAGTHAQDYKHIKSPIATYFHVLLDYRVHKVLDEDITAKVCLYHINAACPQRNRCPQVFGRIFNRQLYGLVSLFLTARNEGKDQT